MLTEASQNPLLDYTGYYPACGDLFQGWVLDVVLGRIFVGELVDDVEAFTVRVVDLHERLPLIGKRVLGEDRLDRAFRFAGAAIYTFLWIDHQDALGLVNAVDGAHVDARKILNVDARLGDDVRHRVVTLAPAEAQESRSQRPTSDPPKPAGKTGEAGLPAGGVMRPADAKHRRAARNPPLADRQRSARALLARVSAKRRTCLERKRSFRSTTTGRSAPGRSEAHAPGARFSPAPGRSPPRARGAVRPCLCGR